ncbi:intradiol ring-cleavage dioxygenase [Leeuwenhoekiella sp. ZYFB001]|uniref:dioxygenase family protein n=1 Tax=Leeuwenhoekiella sp. ZYFB001 TaxID=2719912 RepID=UPI001431BCB3|nr:intradiol ring-cleavage dioxygenase [Leeuwenhoekiella sp. ZYFB001]
MDRKEFLKGIGLMGLAATGAGLFACSSDNDALTATDSNTDSSGATDVTSTSSECAVTNSETAGPFPTNDPEDLERVDITGDRTGVALAINLVIRDVNNACAVLQNAIVDIWHCDADGNYSEYGGSGMQSTNYQNYHFLRGRQISDADGLVKFQSIFPGWYNSRATHIHVHIYNTTGTSLLVTQIAFPEGDDSAVVAVNAASDYGYTKGMSGYTYNANDNVFSDGVANELATLGGSVSEGYTLDHIINVKA